ncbi:MAG: DNA gyrase subunit A [Tissierellia bacterium]|nr:DNA gyrase subunit A [Tissierellia bacterium]
MSEIKDTQTIVDIDLKTEMKESYLDYAMSVIVSRALPDVRDGLKPVHRRIIYGMNELGLYPDRPYRKSARLVGDVMGKFHPHGDSAIYDAVVRLAQDFSTRYPLADGQGNYGSIDGDGAAAMRYTEVRMTKLAQEMLRYINKDTVDFVPNFDESEMEPSVLPSKFPNLIVNGSSGIAVGMATNMAPHNLNETIDGVIAYIDNPEIDVEGLMEHIKGPDFPTGGMIMGKKAIREAYETGRGKLQLRAVVDIEQNKKRTALIVKELPYQVNKSRLILKIAEYVQEKRIEGISDLRDESNRNGMRIVIELKRDAIPEVVLNNLYKHTALQTTFGIINIALVDGEPIELGLKDLIKHYVNHQIEIIERRTRFDLDKAEKRAHILEGLQIAIDNIDEIIKIIRSSYSDAEIKAEFLSRFGLTDVQSQAILDMQLKRLSGLQREKLQEEYADLIKEIARLKEILANPNIRNNIIKEELKEIAEKYGDLRRTALMPAAEEINLADMIREEDVVITLTNNGYIKRMPEGAYKPQNRGGVGIRGLSTKDGDFVCEMFIVNTHDNILFFTNFGNIFSLRGYDIPEAGRQARGSAIVNLLALKPGEEVSTVLAVKEFDDNKYFTMVTKKGTIKKTICSEFKNMRKSGLIAIKLREDDELIEVEITEGNEELILSTKNGYSIRFDEKDVTPTSRNTQGVIGIRLRENDEVVNFSIVDDDKFLVSVGENGYGKLTPLTEYNNQNRGGMGVISYKITEKTGNVISSLVVSKEDQLMLITEEGVIIRIAVDQISIFGRNTQGVKLMNLKESKVVAVAKFIGE